MKYTKIYCTCPEAIDHQTMWWRTLGGHSSSNLTPLCDSISIFNKIKSACSHPSPGTVLLLFLINSCCCSLQSGGRQREGGGAACVSSPLSLNLPFPLLFLSPWEIHACSLIQDSKGHHWVHTVLRVQASDVDDVIQNDRMLFLTSACCWSNTRRRTSFNMTVCRRKWHPKKVVVEYFSPHSHWPRI